MSSTGGGKASVMKLPLPDMAGRMDFDEELKTHEQRRKRFTWVHMTQDARDSKEAAVVRDQDRLPLSKEDCDVLNALQRDPEGENEVLYPNQCSIVKGGETTPSAKCIESCFKCFRALIAVISSLKDPKYEDRVQWAITILDSIMIDDDLIRAVFSTMDTAPHATLAPARADEIRRHVKQSMKPVSLLCTKFTSGNFIIRCRAVHAVAMLYQGGMDLGLDDVSLVEFAIKECRKYVNEELGHHPSAPMVVDCFLLLIQSLLQYPQKHVSYRERFIQNTANGAKATCGLDVCIDTLQRGSSWFQITYRALNIVWLCTLSTPSSPLLLNKQLAHILVDILKKEERKEKNVRMAISIMVNLSAQSQFLDMILPLGVLRTVEQNMLRVFSDTDIQDLLKTLHAKLQAHVDGKGTWDEYRKELLSGHLDWTPAHRSKAFWTENHNKLCDNDFMALKSLIVVLQNKDKKTTPIEIAVVLNDLAMFMKFHSNGKKILTTLNCKETILSYLMSDNDAIKREAIACVSEMLTATI